MKSLVSLALILALAGCSGEKREDRQRRKQYTDSTSESAKVVTQAGNSIEAEENVDTTTVPASYQAFPEEVRRQIYQWDLLDQKCSGRFRGRREAACEASDAIAKALLAKGWCHGGSDNPVLAHWVPCEEDYPGGAGWIADAAAPPKAEPEE